MATTRNPKAADDDAGGADAQSSGFSDEQMTELEALISRAVGSSKAPESKSREPKVTTDEWDAMSDRQRESWVRSLVDFRLDELSRDDEIARQRAEIDALKADKTPEPEATPDPVNPLDKFRKWLWGGE